MGCGASNQSVTAAQGGTNAKGGRPVKLQGAKEGAAVEQKKDHVSLGVIRLDYNYPPAPGDIDSPDSYAYDVHFRCVPGFTFAMCQSGKMTPEVEAEFIEAIKELEAKGVCGFTGDCGFMMFFQGLARRTTKKPVFMSALSQLPAVTCAFSQDEQVVIMTANGNTLEPMRDLIRDECGVDTQKKRFHVVGCEDVAGFEAVALGEKVDVAKCTPGIVKKAQDAIKMFPQTRAILLECTELPPYADAIRHATGLPVYDAITNCDFFVMGFQDNKRFGIDFMKEWDGDQDGAKYKFGQELGAED